MSDSKELSEKLPRPDKLIVDLSGIQNELCTLESKVFNGSHSE